MAETQKRQPSLEGDVPVECRRGGKPRDTELAQGVESDVEKGIIDVESGGRMEGGKGSLNARR